MSALVMPTWVYAAVPIACFIAMIALLCWDVGRSPSERDRVLDLLDQEQRRREGRLP